jgi:hypothetical protein
LLKQAAGPTQAWQATPPPPQLKSELLPRQAEPAQQPMQLPGPQVLGPASLVPPTQRPALHVAPAPQAMPQPPQLAGSAAKSKQFEPQADQPATQEVPASEPAGTQKPPETQAMPVPQTAHATPPMPQLPPTPRRQMLPVQQPAQLPGPHVVATAPPSTEEAEQTPPWQVVAAGHEMPQPPQLPGSKLGLMQRAPHII